MLSKCFAQMPFRRFVLFEILASLKLKNCTQSFVPFLVETHKGKVLLC